MTKQLKPSLQITIPIPQYLQDQILLKTLSRADFRLFMDQYIKDVLDESIDKLYDSFGK